MSSAIHIPPARERANAVIVRKARVGGEIYILHRRAKTFERVFKGVRGGDEADRKARPFDRGIASRRITRY